MYTGLLMYCLKAMILGVVRVEKSASSSEICQYLCFDISSQMTTGSVMEQRIFSNTRSVLQSVTWASVEE